MAASGDLADAVGFFRGAFTIVMGLALGEAFKQFVAERVGEDQRSIHWDRFPSLISFLFLIVPFYQGMSRYLFSTYHDPTTMPQPYSAFLTFDGVNFLIESALFFVMSRALPASQWRRYYICALMLLVVDSLWIFTSTHLHGSAIQPWMYLNLGFAPVLLIGLLLGGQFRDVAVSSALMLLVIARTVLDYYFSWNFYFPVA